MAKSTTNNKRDFIELLSSMTPAEINEFVKKNGKPPKKVAMIRLLTPEEIKNK